MRAACRRQQLLCFTSSLLLAAWLCPAACSVELPFCTNKKIYVLDLNDYAGENPPCHVDDVAVVNPASGIVYTPDARLQERASHKYGTHSAPWYVSEAIKASQYVTDDIDEADIVFVNDYCYYIWWLGWVHTKGREHKDTPGDYLVAALTAMVASPRFKRNNGRDYVFYDSHPGFTAGNAAHAYWTFICHVFKHSTHIVVERAQRNVCPTYWDIEKKLLITPYVPNFEEQARQYEAWLAPLKPLADRRLLLYAKARCLPYKVDAGGNVINVGKKMRHDFVNVMAGQGEDVQVQCTDANFGMKHESFRDMLGGMQSARFCLGLPGDAASVRRMSEMFMAGCLPVFAGPPYATMPLPADVDYRKLGLYYNITNYHSWQAQDFQWAIHPTVRAQHPQNSWFWVPDADVTSLMINVANAADVVPHLRSIPQAKLDSMFEAMESQRQRFVFHDHLTPYWSAVNAIISRVCAMSGTTAQQRPERRSTASGQKDRPRRARRSHRAAEAVRLRASEGKLRL